MEGMRGCVCSSLLGVWKCVCQRIRKLMLFIFMLLFPSFWAVERPESWNMWIKWVQWSRERLTSGAKTCRRAQTCQLSRCVCVNLWWWSSVYTCFLRSAGPQETVSICEWELVHACLQNQPQGGNSSKTWKHSGKACGVFYGNENLNFKHAITTLKRRVLELTAGMLFLCQRAAFH